MASAAAGPGFAYVSTTSTNANGDVTTQSVWVVEKEDLDAHPFMVRYQAPQE
jgi:hypothetical protein